MEEESEVPAMHTNPTTPKGPFTPIPYKPKKKKLPLILLTAVVLIAILGLMRLPKDRNSGTNQRDPVADFGGRETQATLAPTERIETVPSTETIETEPPTDTTEPVPVTEPVVDTSGEAHYRVVRWDRSYRTENEESGMDYYFEYVILEGDSPAYQKINDYLYADAEKFMTTYSTGSVITAFDDSPMIGSYYGESRVIYNENGLICIKVYTEDYMGGNTSHSDSYSMFFCLDTGEIAGLPELTGIDAETLLPQLRSIAIEKLKNSYGSMLLDSAESTVSHMTLEEFDYYVYEGEIWLHFPKYSVTPGVCGAVNISTGLYIGGN